MLWPRVPLISKASNVCRGVTTLTARVLSVPRASPLPEGWAQHHGPARLQAPQIPRKPALPGPGSPTTDRFGLPGAQGTSRSQDFFPGFLAFRLGAIGL